MPANDPPRRITITKVPYNYEHSRTSVSCYSQVGEYLVPAKVAYDAVAKGYAIEGWASESTTRTTKGGPRRRKAATGPRKSATTSSDAANVGPSTGMGRADVSAAHRAVSGQPVADSAE